MQDLDHWVVEAYDPLPYHNQGPTWVVVGHVSARPLTMCIGYIMGIREMMRSHTFGRQAPSRARLFALQKRIRNLETGEVIPEEALL